MPLPTLHRGRVDVCPYQGLARFETSDAEFFFGREQLVADAGTPRERTLPRVGRLLGKRQVIVASRRSASRPRRRCGARQCWMADHHHQAGTAPTRIIEERPEGIRGRAVRRGPRPVRGDFTDARRRSSGRRSSMRSRKSHSPRRGGQRSSSRCERTTTVDALSTVRWLAVARSEPDTGGPHDRGGAPASDRAPRGGGRSPTQQG